MSAANQKAWLNANYMKLASAWCQGWAADADGSTAYGCVLGFILGAASNILAVAYEVAKPSLRVRKVSLVDASGSPVAFVGTFGVSGSAAAFVIGEGEGNNELTLPALDEGETADAVAYLDSIGIQQVAVPLDSTDDLTLTVTLSS